MLVPFNDDQSEMLGTILNLSGIAGAIIVSYIQAQFEVNLLRMNQVVCLLTLVSLLLFWGLIKSHLACVITVMVLGFVNVPMLFISYELAVE